MKKSTNHVLRTTAALLAASLLSATAFAADTPVKAGGTTSTPAGASTVSNSSTTPTGKSGSSSGASSTGASVPGASAASASSPSAAKSAPSGAGKTAVSGSDKQFMTKAAADGIAEVVTGKLAQNNGGNGEVKKFGERMATDHSKANDELKSIAQQKGVTLPDDTDRTHKRLAKQLENLQGDKFDQVYAREAGVKDHKAAVALFTREAQKGSDPDVRAFAQKTLPTLQAHLQMAQTMHDAVMAKK